MKRLLIILSILFSFTSLSAQTRSAGGVVLDSLTNKPMDFISVYFKNTSSGCVTNSKGEFYVKDSSGADTLVVDAVGYAKRYLLIKPGQNSNLTVRLKPASIELAGAVIKPKRERYRRKDNPAVELIRKVIANKDRNHVEDKDYYKCKMYEKITLSLDDYKPDMEKEKNQYLAQWIDTSEVTGKPILTLSIREALGDYYYRNSPETVKKIITAKQHKGLDQEFDHNGGLSSSIDHIFTGVDIYDNEITFLANRFISPISSSLATAYYKYYIMDTVKVDNVPCIDLAFVPFNSQSFGFTGRLYITDDENYSIKKIQLNFPASSNINWIDKLRIDQEYVQLEDGSWALKQEDSYVNLTLLESTQGIFAHQTRSFDDYVINDPELKNDPAYMSDGEETVLPGAESFSESYWEEERITALNKRESNIALATDDIARNTPVITWMRVADALVSGYVPTTGAKATSKFDFGPILNTVGHDYIEGLRVRVGGMTTANLSDRWFGSGYLAYGMQDKMVKGSIKLTHSFNKKHYHPDETPINNLSASYTYDIFSPEIIGEQHDILSSIKAGTVKKLQYIRKTNVKYERQWINSLRTSFWVENNKYTPATTLDPGTLRYELIMPDGSTNRIPNITTTEIGAQIRWAPGDKPFNSVNKSANINKDIPVFTLSHTMGIKGFLGGEYNFNRTEFSMFKRFHLPIAGFLDAKISAGKVWDQVPWPLLIIPAANQSFAYKRETFHMMNALEFVTDQYAQVNLTWHLKGMIVNRIPLLKHTRLRELLIFNAFYGNLSEKNDPRVTPGLFALPEGTGVMENVPYMEVGVGVENVFRLLRLAYFYRISYRENNLSWLGKWGGFRVAFYIDF